MELYQKACEKRKQRNEQRKYLKRQQAMSSKQQEKVSAEHMVAFLCTVCAQFYTSEIRLLHHIRTSHGHLVESSTEMDTSDSDNEPEAKKDKSFNE